MFDHKTEIRAKKDGVDVEELELELIDYGAESVEMDEEAGEILIEGTFEGGTKIQGYLEENEFEILSSEYVYLPNNMKEVTPEQREKVQKLLDKIEEDDDVQNVFHNMVEDETEEA